MIKLISPFINLAFYSLITINTFGQNETNVWYFGDGAGLDFNAGVNPTILEDGELDAFEGCASICNEDGELLFYTDGMTVFRSDHQVMTNGFDIDGNMSSIQSSIIVPSPANDGNIYLFALDTDFLLGGDYTGLSYSIIDMNQWDGYGAVTEVKNIPLSDEPVFEGLTAVHHANGIDVWIITQEMDSWIYEAYLLTAEGVSSTPVQSDAGIVEPLGYQSCLKAAPNGLRIASSYSGNKKVEVLDFDSYTGILSNALDLELDGDNVQEWAPYGCEFSPNGERLYVSHLDYGPIVQYDLSADDVPASRMDVGINNGVSGNPPYSLLQLAPNGKIYIAAYDEQFIAAINEPNELAPLCDFEEEAISFLTKTCKFGLPQFVQSSFVEAQFAFNQACRGDTVFFTPFNVYDSLLWDFGDPSSGDNNYSTEINPYHIYENEGNYQVSVELYISETVVISSEGIFVPGPTLNLGANDTICSGDNYKIDATTAGALSYLWFDDSSQPVKWVKPSGTYWVTVDEGLCQSTDTISILAVDCAYMLFPNIFTPNNDSYNELFLAIESVYVLKFEISIFDRWGNLVYTSTYPTEGWNGKNLKGKDVSEGVFFYIVNYSGERNVNRTIKGDVHLTRTRER